MEIKAKGANDSLKFAIDYGVVNENIFGSDVEVSGDSERAILDVKRCDNL